MTYLANGQDILTPPLDEQTGRSDVSEVDFALQSQDPVAARRLSENSPVFGDTPMGEDFPLLPQNIESPFPFAEQTVDPSSTQLSLPLSSPLPRRIEASDDISAWNLDEQPTTPAVPRIRDDIEPDGDVSMWDPDEEPAKNKSSGTP